MEDRKTDMTARNDSWKTRRQMSQQRATHGRQEDRYDSQERPNGYGNRIMSKEACWLHIFKSYISAGLQCVIKLI